MTTPNTTRKAGPLLGTGSQTAWPFSFKVFAAGDIRVTTANSAGDETTLVLNTDYTVALNSNQETSPGGTVTYPISGSALPVGSVLAIVGNLDYGQPLDLPSGGNFSPQAIENQLDRTTMQIQQLREEMDRTAKLPPTSSDSVEDLVDDLQRIADSADNLDTVASNIASVNTVAADLNEPVSEIATVAASITNVDAVGSNIDNVNTVAGISANVTTVASIAADVTAVAGVASSVPVVADIAADVIAVAAIDDDVTIAAANVADITNFADVYYGPSSAGPTLRRDGSALQEGDLYYDTGVKRMRVFNGTVWIEGNLNASTLIRNTFSGAGGTTFTLSAAPGSKENTQVYIGGVYQQKSEYSVTGTSLAFNSAPPTASNNIEVIIITPMAVGVPASSAADSIYSPAGVGAVPSTVETKLREVVSVKDYGVDSTGVSSCVLGFQKAALALAAAGGVLKIPAGTYWFSLASDADTIQLPSNCTVDCEPGVTFRWDYWGSPLFAIVNKSNIVWEGRGAKFVWAGTFGTTSGSRDAFGFGKTIPAYEWCAHVASVGSSYVNLRDLRCEGSTTGNNQNVFLLFRGTAAGDRVRGNKIIGIEAHDVSQGALWSEQEAFEIDMVGGRYSSASAGLYGPGHTLYITEGDVPSRNGTIKVRDNADSRAGVHVAGAHSVSLKNLHNADVKVSSARPEGGLNFNNIADVIMDVSYRSSDTTADPNGVVFGSNPLTGNADCKLKVRSVFESPRNMSVVNLGGIAASSSNLNFELDADIVVTQTGTEAAAAILWVADKGVATVRYENKGSGAARPVLTADKGSNGNNFFINTRGTVANPRVLIGATGSPANNTFYCSGDSTVDFDANEFTPSSGNAVVWQGHRQYASQRNLGTVTNPAAEFTLPLPGAYLVNVEMKSSDNNHSRAGLYWVVWDNASANDYVTAQLLGAQISKGGVAPSALALTVNNSGVCAVSCTAGSNTWLMKYGYRQLAQD